MVNDEHMPQRQPEDPSGPLPSAKSGRAPLLERRRAVVERDASKLPEPFDAANVLHVDAAARVLLRRFYERNDARCFDLLVELTERPLAAMSLDVVREVGLAIAADVLHGAMLGALFIDTRPEQVDVRQFLAFAHKRLEQVARARAKWLAGRPIPRLERLPSGLPQPRAPYPGAPFDEDPPEDPVAIDALVQGSGTSAVAAPVDFARLGFDFTWLVETLFHRLDADARVLLRAAEIERKSPEQIAEWREMDPAAVVEKLSAARTALTLSIEDACRRLAAHARRSGCTLSGKRPEEIDAEDVAQHLMACDTCLAALDVPPATAQQAQGAALAALGGAVAPASNAGARQPASAVESLVAQARGRGKEELGRFLYELARACLLEIPEVRDRAAVYVEPQRPAVLSGDVDRLGSRVGVDAQELACRDRWLDAAERVVARLADVMPHEPGTMFLQAKLAKIQGRLDVARSTLEDLVRSHSESPWGKFAQLSLLDTLVMLADDDAITSVANELVKSQVDVRSAHLALCIVAARRGLPEAFASEASAFRAAALSPLERGSWVILIKDHASQIATGLGLSTDMVMSSLGLSDLEDAP